MRKIIYQRKKAQEDGSEPKKGISAKVILYCIIVTAALYVLLIFIEKSIVNADDKAQVYVTVKEVPDNLEISELNIAEYFKIEDRPESVIPDGCITQAEQLVGHITDRALLKNEIITVTSLSTQDERTKDIAHPIEVSLNASNLSQFVGGVLRTGDYINIWSVKSYTVNGETITETENICNHAYVTRTFSSSGEAAAEGDSDMATMIINIVIPAEQEEEFNTAVVDGTLRVGRYLYEYDAADDEPETTEADAATGIRKDTGSDEDSEPDKLIGPADNGTDSYDSPDDVPESTVTDTDE